MTTMTVLGLKGATLLAITWLACVALRRTPAALRHLLWSAGLAGALAVPVLHLGAPKWELPVLGPAPAGVVVERPAPAATRPESSASGTRSSVESVRPNTQRVARDDAGRPRRIDAVRGVEGPSGESPGTEASPPVRSAEAGGVATAGRVAPSDRDDGAGFVPDVAWLPLLWAVGALALLFGSLRSHLAAWRLTRETLPADGDVRELAARRAHDLGIRRRVRVGVHPAVTVPATWGLRSATVVLPVDHREWPRETLDHVLMHELAHVRRADCLWQLVGEIARAVHWPNPLAWLAVRRQREEGEAACDDQVLDRGARASRYAEDLLLLARRGTAGPRLPEGALAMARRTSLSERLDAILDPGRRRGRLARLTVALVGVTVAAAATSMAGMTPVAKAQARPVEGVVPERSSPLAGAPVPSAAAQAASPDPTVGASRVEPASVSFDGEGSVPTPSQERCTALSGERRSTSISSDDDHTRMRFETDACRLDLEMRGDVEFAADDSGVERMAAGAFFEIEERVAGLRRRARLEGTAGGAIERRYWVDGREEAWGTDADRWLGQVLPEVFRQTTLNAENRTRRFLAEGGPDRVLDEIERMGSDHVARTYMDHLLSLSDLDEAETGRLLSIAARDLESDHHLADVLIRVAETRGLAPAYRAQVLAGVRTLESDHHRRRVLEAMLAEPDLTQEQLDDIVSAASEIESDHHLAEVLTRVVREGMLSAGGRAAFVQAMGSLESDHQHRSVLEAFLDRGGLSTDELNQVLAYTEDLESDHHRAAVLQRVAGEYELSGSQLDAYLAATSRIGSDHHKRETAVRLLDRADLDAEQLDLVFEIADDIASDHHRSGVLGEVVRRHDLDADGVQRLLEVADGIASDHNHAETLLLLIEDERLDASGQLGVLRSAGRIGSDHNRTQVLVGLAGRYDLEGEVRTAYRDVAEEIGSTHLRNEALAALVR